MEKIRIKGGRRLFGEVVIGGAKNSAVAIIPATILCSGVCRIENMPRVSDVQVQLQILKEMGAVIRAKDDTTVEIDARPLSNGRTSYDLTRKIRASYYLLGALLGRFGDAEVSLPGGCNFGSVRPIDQHIKGFEALGASVDVRGGYIHASAPEGLIGTSIYLDKVSVGATMNVILAAVLAQGETIIGNPAKEPHIVDLANFLNVMGADVRGAGTDTIRIKGVKSLHGGTYSIIPDQIEAGTYMAAVCGTGGNLLVKNVIPKHLDCITAKLEEMGAEIEELDDAIRIIRRDPIRRTNIRTLPYPGFPTDMQPQLATVLCAADGPSIITEGIWDTRYLYVDELRRMGANIRVDGKVATVDGGTTLSGATVRAVDLRAGAAMVIAGLMANGTTTIEDINYIERGYEDIVGKLRRIGADITIVDEPPVKAEIEA